MSALTVESDYGPLPLAPTNNRNPECELPDLKFETGDTYIALGPDAPDDGDESNFFMVVHSKLIRELCSVMGLGFSQQWMNAKGGPLDLKHPTTGQMKLVWCRASNFIAADRAYILEGSKIVMDERYTAVNFFKSSLATEDWPGDAYHMYRVTKRAFRIFFSLLYGARLTLDQILGCPASEYDRDHRINGEAFTITLLVCAYAELYGCLEWIGPRMMVILQSSPNFWEAVADKPREHLMLAEKLEQGEVWNDAFRHMVGRASMTGNWEDIEEITEYDSAQLRELFDPQFKTLDIKFRDLYKALQNLQLLKHRTKYYGGEWHDSPTRVLDVVALRKKPAVKVRHMAGMMFGEWTVYQTSGESVRDCWSGVRGKETGGFHQMIRKLEQTADWTNPGGILGGAAPTVFGDMYGFSAKEKHQFRAALSDFVREATQIVNNAFPISSGKMHIPFDDTSVPFTQKRAHFDVNLGNYNYFKIPDTLLWTHSIDATFVSRPLDFIVPGIDVTPASAAWMATLAEQYQAEAWELTVRDFEQERFAAEFATAEPDSADSVSADDTAAEASTAEASTTEDPIPDNAWDPIAETPDASTFVADSYADEGEF